MSLRGLFGRKQMAIADASETVGTAELVEISDALHDLCQPLTILQCRLEMGRLMGTPESYREAVTLALADCYRLMNTVEAMREIVQRAAAEPVQVNAGAMR
jgi:hypothetical protein